MPDPSPATTIAPLLDPGAEKELGTGDELPLGVEAALEATQSESKPEPLQRRGLASLRGVKRTTYMRRSVLRMLAKSPEELEAYSPANGFELLAKQMLTLEGSARLAAMQVWREIKETLGERIGSRNKDTLKKPAQPKIISDLLAISEKLN